MASACNRFASRTSLSSIKSAIRSSVRTSPSFTKSATSIPLRRFSLSRIPVELGGVQSLLPLHSAVATARMTSCLSTTSRICRALSQEWLIRFPTFRHQEPNKKRITIYPFHSFPFPINKWS
ncbi:protein NONRESPONDING TO OXYLIPINS 2, mitochondrial-like isoform X2 [Castanea sativa]|uniref:protein NONRESPONDING TO OXYLIPINS 2, mitochondrial-like isoform X2 n=1 Tax=Castanea sativa TaxID=21020 RepID=UPI003F64CB54